MVHPINKQDKVLITIILLKHKADQGLKKRLQQLLKTTPDKNIEILIAANQSKVSSLNKKWANKACLSWIQTNSQPTQAFNQAVHAAKGEYVVLMDNSVSGTANWLTHLMAAAETKQDFGAIAPDFLYQTTDRLKPWYQFWKKQQNQEQNQGQAHSSGLAFNDFVDHFALESTTETDHNSLKPRVCLSHHCLLMRKQTYLDSGGLNEDFDYHQAITDLCLRMWQNQLKNYSCSQSQIICMQNESEKKHMVSTSFQKTWHATIKKHYWSEKLYSSPLAFSASKMTVAIAVTDHGDAVTAGDYYSAQELAIELQNLGWDVVFLSRYKNEWYNIADKVDVLINLLDEYDLAQIPKRNKKLITIAWARNWFDKWCQSPCFNHYNLVFASSPSACDYIAANSRKQAQLLPLASSATRFGNKPQCDAEKYSSDICFTGSYWGHPRDIMTALSKKILSQYDFHVYGANWQNYPGFKAYDKGFLDYEKMPCVYHHSSIVIDDANHVTKPYGSVNSRVFDALMSGTLVISNGVKGSNELFNGQLPCYQTPQELEKLLLYYLQNPEARQQKTDQLKQLVLEKHSYKHRAKTLLSALKDYLLKPSIAIKIPAPSWLEAKNWGDYHMAESLKTPLEEQGYRVLLQMLNEWDNTEGLQCDSVLVLRGLSQYQLKPHQLNLMWNISHPDKVSIKEYQQYDQIFIASEYWSKQIAKGVTKPVTCLLQCTDTSRFKQPNPDEKQTYKHQLLFVGNSRKVFRTIIKDLLPSTCDLAVYGNDWQGLIPNKYIKGEHIDNAELYKYYGSATILLNDHWPDMREKGFISNRIFDGLACAALIITDNVKNLGELENYLQIYHSPEELKQLIQFYLDNPQQRKQKTNGCRAFIQAHHTFSHRAVSIVNSIEKYGGFD
jgi:spore maturation protein CgeB